MRARFGRNFRRIITNSPDGLPPWLATIESGSDLGFYKPTDAPWVVHADIATLVGGIRALLMQALHPGSLAGVADHSRYEADPLGRLAGTTKWLTILTFGSTDSISKESARVNAMHKKVVGEYTDNAGEQKSYQAADEDLLLWVHIAFTESFLVTHQNYGLKEIPGGADAYIRQWAKAVAPLGLVNAPKSLVELHSAISQFENILTANETTHRVVDFIKHPPLSKAALIPYSLLFQAAAVTIDPAYLKILGIKTWPRVVVKPLARALMRTMRFLLGGQSPIEEAALKRHARLASN